jgi:hypothetical protein
MVVDPPISRYLQYLRVSNFILVVANLEPEPRKELFISRYALI